MCVSRFKFLETMVTLAVWLEILSRLNVELLLLRYIRLKSKLIIIATFIFREMLDARLFTFKVLPISSDVIDDSRYSKAEDAHLLASSSALIRVDLLNDPTQAVTLYIPCDKPKSRPWTAEMSSRISTGDSGVSRIKSRAKSREAVNNFNGREVLYYMSINFNGIELHIVILRTVLVYQYSK